MADSRIVRLIWSSAGALSDEADAPVYLYPVAIRVPPSGWATSQVSVEVKDEGGNWYRVWLPGDRITVPAGDGTVGVQVPLSPTDSAGLALTSRSARRVRVRAWTDQSAGAWIELLYLSRWWL